MGKKKKASTSSTNSVYKDQSGKVFSAKDIILGYKPKGKYKAHSLSERFNERKKKIKKISYDIGVDTQASPNANDMVNTNNHELGGYGFNLTDNVFEFDSSKDYEKDSGEESVKDKITDESMISLLINIGDSLDEEGEDVLADFSDFLISKFAIAVKNEEYHKYEDKFKELILLLNSSSLRDKNKKILEVSKAFNTILVNSGTSGEDIKKDAYMEALKLSKTFLENINEL